MVKNCGEREIIVGIDFGTTNSLVAYLDENLVPKIIPNDRGSHLTPSAVYFKNNSEVIIGEIAKSQRLLRPNQTILAVKRYIGEEYEYNVLGNTYTPTQIASLIFRKLIDYASEFLGCKVSKAVVTVPAYFDDNQRQGVLTAAKLAGIEIVKLLNEPTAAALAYNVSKGMSENESKNVLVLDFGGGTFDLTLMRVSSGLYEVISTIGNTMLGGLDFDKVIVDWIVETVKDMYGKDLTQDIVAMQQIWNHAERGKIDLSTVLETDIVIPYISMTENGPLHINLNISRERFETLASKLFKMSEELILKLFENSNVKMEDVDTVIFSGGTSRTPGFKNMVRRLFPNAEILGEINPDEVVALGAAIQAAIIEGRLKSIELMDVLSHTLGVLDDEGNFVPIIEKDTVYPTTWTKIFTNTMDDQDTIIIKVLQEHDDELIELGNLEFKSEKKWMKNEANIAISFHIDKNGILFVTAEDLESGKTEELQIKNGILHIRNTDFAELSEKLKLINVL